MALVAQRANWNSTGKFIPDVRHFQLTEYDYLYLRCCAKYNKEPIRRH